ncbi:MAG: glycosyltransferase family 92 protein [Campylobacteraceae bacterium]|jgi:hypothetical protein|nr:glycosyltransferase family 92 protein [Campylobacteraceae bacterium]
MLSFIETVSPIVIPENIPIKRDAPRPLDKRDADYEELFDWKTLFYDVFKYNDKIIFSGPPLFNLQSLVQTAKITIDGVLQQNQSIFKDMDRTQNSYLDFQGEAKRLSVDFGSFKTETTIQPNKSDLLKGKKALISKSKNNELVWIRDWVEFYVKIHGVNAVLLYDNASTLYTAENIINKLNGINGLDIVIIVLWPFKFGPQGGASQIWDSDFCEYGLIEHARRCFLSSCDGVISIDIDELVMSEDDKTVFDYMEQSETKAISFTGVWVDSALDDKIDNFRHRDFKYIDKNSSCPVKWAAKPSAIPDTTQIVTHAWRGQVPIASLKYRHFRAINTGWKYKGRNIIKTFDVNKHEIDYELISVMQKLKWR